MGKLDGKVAIITGTSPNIGGGIAEVMADEGAKLVCVDINPDNALQCAEYIRKRGGEAIGIPCDITNEEQVKGVIDRTRQEFGGVDIVVNGAVIYNMKGVLTMPLDEWRRQIDIILTGAFLFTKYAAQLMIEQGRRGNILNIVSTEGHQGNPGNIGYGSGKSGLLNFTRSAAMELAPYGIRVNSLSPVSTDPAEGVERAVQWGRPRVDVSESLVYKRAKMLPLQKAPSPRHYAKAVVFLTSDDAEMITGTDLRVDAGAVARFWAWMPGQGT
jgi:NAD(P)-dependent dehydrogenase (short-subunit alcohol dehydrogenase family)